MALGRDFSCGLLASGEIECFGDDTYVAPASIPAGPMHRLSLGTNMPVVFSRPVLFDAGVKTTMDKHLAQVR